MPSSSSLKSCWTAQQNSGWLTRLLHSGPSTSRNLYSILGVDKSATLAEIKAAFYSRSKLLHPDRLSDASVAERERAHHEFLELKAAYDILRRPVDRRHYDLREAGIYTGSSSYRRPASSYGGYRPFNDPHYNYHGNRRGADWRAFWRKSPDDDNDPASAQRHNSMVFHRLMFWLSLGTVLVVLVNAHYVYQYTTGGRAKAGSDADEIARAFLRQFHGSNSSPGAVEVAELAQILRHDIYDAARRRDEERLEADERRRTMEIREESRWMDVVRTPVSSAEARKLQRRSRNENE